MKITRAAAFSSLILLASCGGGGGDSESEPTASKDPVVQTAPVQTPAVVTPVTQPIVGQPIASAPVTDTKPVESTAPAPTPTTPVVVIPPQPAEGTYILGRVVKAALRSNPNNLGNCNQQYYYYSYNSSCDTTAYEAKNGVPDVSKQGIRVGFWLGATYFSHYGYPTGYDYNNPNPKFPQAQINYQIVYPNGILALSKTLSTNSNGKEKALVRPDGDFEIKDDLKFIIDTSAATWEGVEGEGYWFVQLQVSSFSASNTVFKLCFHEYFPGVRRLACTLHNKDTGEYKGTQVLDDSRGLGAVEYLTRND